MNGVNLLAFLTGVLLYSMLVALVVHGARVGGRDWWARRDRLPLLTGVAGLIWNLGGLIAAWIGAVTGVPAPAWLQAASFAALGTLPAFIVHSLFQGGERVAGPRVKFAISAFAYVLVSAAAGINVWAAAHGDTVPARLAVWLLTGGFTALTAVMLVVSRGGPVGRRGVWVAALSIFAVSSWHFEPHGPGTAWWIELLLHHASIPLALAILHQDYRFAFADLFLKHALALLALMGISATLMAIAIVPLVRGDFSLALEPQAAALAVLLWAATAASFPLLVRTASRLVDRIVLRRPDYAETLVHLDHALQESLTEDAVRQAVSVAVSSALHAEDLEWLADPVAATDRRGVIVGTATRAYGPDSAALLRPDTVSDPRVAIRIGALGKGRRLLSDDQELLAEVARLVARRLDSLRVANERLEASVREQRMQQLATEAELRALRSQINPHFLFNALTTIGYLIQTAPDRALQTLLKLTGVLRGVLRQSQAEFVPLRDELSLVRDYLDIEMARFEGRLRVVEEIDERVLNASVPPFILQPIVENAVKHGIAPMKDGGTVGVSVQWEGRTLVLIVTDSGQGAAATTGAGVGLQNVERRLEAHYGAAAALVFSATPGTGATVRLSLPLAPDTSFRGRP
ncbi:MAG: hypothetical protein FJW21_10030 [Acidimicrobiia bacterium]|nr:hypothetical protein [Acidimicrobiia bacterium]